MCLLHLICVIAVQIHVVSLMKTFLNLDNKDPQSVPINKVLLYTSCLHTSFSNKDATVKFTMKAPLFCWLSFKQFRIILYTSEISQGNAHLFLSFNKKCNEMTLISSYLSKSIYRVFPSQKNPPPLHTTLNFQNTVL